MVYKPKSGLICLQNKENHLVSYLDYKIRTDGDIELGIQLTSETERKKHFATALINYLRFKYMYAKFFTGTYEENEKMRAVLKITGFHEYLLKAKTKMAKRTKTSQSNSRTSKPQFTKWRRGVNLFCILQCAACHF